MNADERIAIWAVGAVDAITERERAHDPQWEWPSDMPLVAVRAVIRHALTLAIPDGARVCGPDEVPVHRSVLLKIVRAIPALQELIPITGEGERHAE